jgi:hypothetical protein
MRFQWVLFGLVFAVPVVMLMFTCLCLAMGWL